jgi:hypothetical protein
MTQTVMLCSESHLPLLRLSVPRLLDAGIVPTVYACGVVVAREAGLMGARVLRILDDEGGPFGSPEFYRFVARKFDVLLDAIEDGDVFFVDTDVMVESNPLPAIDTDCDVFAQSDGRPDVEGDAVCTGCWWLRSCSEVINMLRDARDRLLGGMAPCDQSAVWQGLAEPHSLRIKYAPRDQWQNAARWLASDKSIAPQLIHWNGAGRYSVAEKLAAISADKSPAGSPPCALPTWAEPALISDLERTAS